MKKLLTLNCFLFVVFLGGHYADAQCFFTSSPSAPANGCYLACEDVVWRDIVNSVATGSSITKIAGGNNWNAGAASTASVYNNGYFETVISQTNTDRMFGLSTSNPDANFASIQFAFWLQSSGQMRIYESGNDRGGFGAYSIGDTLRVRVIKNIIHYFRNSTLIYKSTVAPSLPLIADISLFTNATATLQKAVIVNVSNGNYTATSNLAGTNPVYQWKLNNVNVGGNSPNYTNTSLAVNDILICNLTYGTGGCTTGTVNSNQILIKHTTISNFGDYFITASSSSSACQNAIENVVWDTTAAGTINNSVTNNTLTKLQSAGNWDGNGFSRQFIITNGYMQTTVAETNRNRMIGLSASDVNSSFASIQFAFFLQSNGQLRIYQSGADMGGFGAYAAGDVLKIANENNVIKYYKNGQALYISGVVPSATLFVDVSILDVGGTANNVKIANGQIGSFNAVVIGGGPTPGFQWKLNNLNVGSNSSSYTNLLLNNNDAITCVITPSLAGCLTNTTISSVITITNSSFGTINDFYITGVPASSACKEAITDITWRTSSITNNTISTNNVTKIQNGGNWDGNAFSYQSVNTNGYMQTTVAETNRNRMIGLSASDVNSSFASIQFAFYLQSNGQLRIYQSGADMGGFGAYAAGDVLKIANENNVIKYYRNNQALYISGTVPSATLFVDVSILDVGGTATNVKVSNGNISTFTAVTSNAGPSPTYQWKLNNINVGSNIPSYTNTFLNNGDIVSCVVTPSINGCSTSTFSSNQAVIILPGVVSTTWIGTNSNWNTPSNWNNGVPDKYKNAVITGGTSNPVISTNAIANSITIGTGKSLTINSANILDVYGSWNNQGNFIPNTSTVRFQGCANTTTISCIANEIFYNAVITNTFNVLISSGTHSVSNNINFQIGIITNSSNLVVLDNATATNASNISHVNGFVKKVGNDAFVFPVGNNGDYQPISISAPSLTTDQFDAQYIYTNPHPTYNNTLKDASLNNISLCEYWVLNRTNGTSNVSVTLNWDPNSCGIGFLPDLRVARWNGSMWKDMGNGGTGGNTTTGTIVTSGLVNNFSPFTLASSTSANPLPIELLYFTAACNNNIVTFNWATANEINNDYFVIESSLDAINWEIIATKKGAGTSTSEKKYELKVDIISNKPVYYRLKQIDINGSFDYSKLIEVNLCNSDLEDVVIFPNPTTGKLRLMNNSSVSIKSINVYNVMGQKVYMSRTHFEAVDLSEFQDGVYIVNIETEYNNVIKKIIVSK